MFALQFSSQWIIIFYGWAIELQSSNQVKSDWPIFDTAVPGVPHFCPPFANLCIACRVWTNSSGLKSDIRYDMILSNKKNWRALQLNNPLQAVSRLLPSNLRKSSWRGLKACQLDEQTVKMRYLVWWITFHHLG